MRTITKDVNGRLVLNLHDLFYNPNRRDVETALVVLPTIFDLCVIGAPRRPVSMPTALPIIAGLIEAGSGSVAERVPMVSSSTPVRRVQPRLGGVTLPERPTYQIPGVEGTLSNLGRDAAFRDTGAVKVEFGGTPPESINAVTLKHLAGRPRATLLRKDGDVWRQCEDSWRIDLRDPTVEYRLGDVSIYS